MNMQADDKRPVVVIVLPSRKQFGANVLFIPALLHVRRQHPGARFVALANHGTSTLFERWGLVDAVLRHDKQGGGFLSAVRRSLGLRPVLVVNCRPRSIRLHLWTMLMGARERRCFAHSLGRWIDTEAKPWDATRYKAFTYLGMVGAGWQDHSGDLLAGWNHIRPTPEPAGALLLIPSGSKPEKKWPLSKYLEIARRWHSDYGTPVQVLAGPQETEVLEWVARPEVKQAGVSLVAGGLPSEVAAMRAASMVLANDCGPAHLAQLVDAPRVLMFRPAISIREWLRPSAHAEGVQMTCPLPEVPVDAAWSAMQKVLQPRRGIA
jgi:ADP-heptose:LPS heptosyltransferase